MFKRIKARRRFVKHILHNGHRLYVSLDTHLLFGIGTYRTSIYSRGSLWLSQKQ